MAINPHFAAVFFCTPVLTLPGIFAKLIIVNTYTELELSYFESRGRVIAGIDEAGRGPLAGPVIAAAVIFDHGTVIGGIADSKKLSPSKRERLSIVVKEKALCWAVGEATVREIDEMNILEASRLAMKRAAVALAHKPDFCLVDGWSLPGWDFPHEGVIKGDRKCFTIAAASIIAKHYRDEIMIRLDNEFPQYGFARHKGYPTLLHREAIRKYGPCPIHRMTFKLL
ncbi:MAG: ribonuclease HII [FCB group bacterium]|nr:ribonuclease HII [FCB group bacterium]